MTARMLPVRCVTLVALLTLAATASAQDQPAERMTAYPIEITPENVYESPDLTIAFRNLRLSSGPISIVPISCEPGITGAVLIGNGTFRYAPEGGEAIEGQFRAAMLRFNPGDQAAIVPLDKARKVTDRGAVEMSRHLLNVVFGHCWHSGRQALIPPKGSISAVLYSRDHGDLLISDDGQSPIVYNFTDRKTLYQKK